MKNLNDAHYFQIKFRYEIKMKIRRICIKCYTPETKQSKRTIRPYSKLLFTKVIRLAIKIIFENLQIEAYSEFGDHPTFYM